MIEIAGYFAFFWFFIFNKRFRALQLEEWRNGNWLDRFFIGIEALTSVAVGVVLPLAILRESL